MATVWLPALWLIGGRQHTSSARRFHRFIQIISSRAAITHAHAYVKEPDISDALAGSMNGTADQSWRLEADTALLTGISRIGDKVRCEYRHHDAYQIMSLLPLFILRTAEARCEGLKCA